MVQTDEINITEGRAVNGDEMHWEFDCPECEKHYECTGFYDSSEVITCDKCGKKFYVKKVWLNDKDAMV